ncbi:MAG: hypothetical protein LHW56_03755 [Candidatus Cloacimonetes bacterium]|nr:hypothetical protein [Candidatus Cloacimonadota bacterium]MDY0172005.1 hypothetical protein [Candidatus Cloacimonadaceae bacterium]
MSEYCLSPVESYNDSYRSETTRSISDLQTNNSSISSVTARSPKMRQSWLDGIVSSLSDFWRIDQLEREHSTTYSGQKANLFIDDLQWTLTQVLETRMRLLAFEEDWDAPGMEIYDDM